MSFFTSTTITFGLTKDLCLFNADQNSVILFFFSKINYLMIWGRVIFCCYFIENYGYTTFFFHII